MANGITRSSRIPPKLDDFIFARCLIERYDRLKKEKVDPREDNALAITTDGRKLALDARLLSPDAADEPDSKINALADNVAAIWRRTAATRGAQMIFSDMGVNPTPWGFCVYDEVIEKLTQRGIPRQQIATIGEADTDAKKQSLFEKVRQGTIRILLGSTQKMGTGTNAQKRLAAKHDLDPPWKPAEVEQRDGRIMRQGNENDEVAIYRYVTEGSFDAYMWQALETKARFIAQVMSGENAARRAEDIGGQELSYAEVKAIASGNPAVLTLAESDAELARLAILRKNHADEQYLARKAKHELPQTIERLTGRLSGLTADAATLNDHAGDPLHIGGRACARGDEAALLGRRLDALPERAQGSDRHPIGRYHGLAFGLALHPGGGAEVYLEGMGVRHAMLSREHRGPRAVLNALERLAASYPAQCASTRQDLSIAEGQLRDHEARIGRPFGHESYLTELTDLRDRLKAALAQTAPEPGNGRPSIAELAERIKAVRAANSLESAPERSTPRRIAAEEPVTSRIRRRFAQGSGGAQPEPEHTADAGAPPQLDRAHADTPASEYRRHVAREREAVSGGAGRM